MRSTVLIAALCTMACGTQSDQQPTVLTQTGAALSVDYFGDTDVVGMHFEVTRVACDAEDDAEEEVITFNVDLADAIYPGMVELIEQRVDPNSRHLGADLFVSLPEGCYEVLAVPASEVDDDEWEPSEDCSSASSGVVFVEAGHTTAVDPLISQCDGDPLGGLDVTVLLNHPPTLALQIEQTTNYECTPVHVCAIVEDVDDDPIEVTWHDESLFGWFSIEEHEPELIGFTEGHRVWEVCADIVTRYTTEYNFRVEVQDFGMKDGERVPMAELVESGESSTDLAFQIRTNWIEDPMCFDEGGDLDYAPGVEPFERAEGCEYTDAETFYCSGSYPVDDAVAGFLCDDEGHLVEENLYPVCE